MSFASESPEKVVILLHGIARTNHSMEKLAHFLQDNGFFVLNIDYPSRKASVKELADYLAWKLKRRSKYDDGDVYFVGHSLGCLVIHQFIQNYRPSHLARVVYLAPPLKGSEVADVFENMTWFKAFFGPAGQELSSNAVTQVIDDEVNYELGVIAGDRTIDPISSMILPGKNDGKVSVNSTMITGMKDHIVIHASHTFITSNKNVLNQVLYFFNHGEFIHSSDKL